MRRVPTSVGIAIAGLVLVGAAAPQAPPGGMFRVFLETGEALPSYGEPAEVGDRVIFTFVVGQPDGSRHRLQLVDLPAERVDLERTRRYALAVRAAHYAATRGEVEYQAVTADVGRAMDQLLDIDDPRLRLILAERARERLVDWAGRSYGYRATDLDNLTGLFDEVIAELRTAAGETSFDLSLSAPLPSPTPEPLESPPSLRESIRLALATVAASDNSVQRLALLRAGVAVLPADGGATDVRADLERRLRQEVAADHEYAALADDLKLRAAGMRLEASVDAAAQFELLLDELEARDEALGRLRPRVVERIRADLTIARAEADEHRAALVRYAAVKQQLLAYERRVRRSINGLEALHARLGQIRAMTGPSFAQLLSVEGRLERIAEDLGAAFVPPDLVDVHATFQSATAMALAACARRRHAATTDREDVAREASAAAAGALLLAGQAREILVARLFPPGSH